MWADGRYVRYRRSGAIGFVSCHVQWNSTVLVLVEYLNPAMVRVWEDERNIELLSEEEAALEILGTL